MPHSVNLSNKISDVGKSNKNITLKYQILSVANSPEVAYAI
jgi:hypothetical protein